MYPLSILFNCAALLEGGGGCLDLKTTKHVNFILKINILVDKLRQFIGHDNCLGKKTHLIDRNLFVNILTIISGQHVY